MMKFLYIHISYDKAYLEGYTHDYQW